MATQTAQRKPRRPAHSELIALRINQGWSRDDLAYRAGISRETVRLAEAGFLPTPRVQFAIANAFGTTPLVLWPIERQRAGR